MNWVCCTKYWARFDEGEAAYQRALQQLQAQEPIDGEDQQRQELLAAVYHNLGGLEHARRAV